MKSFFRDLWKLTRPYWCQNQTMTEVRPFGKIGPALKVKEKWFALFLLAVIIGFNLGQVYLNVRITEWRNGFYESLQNYDKKAFYDSIGVFCVLAAFFIFSAVYSNYVNQMLTIKWRTWLTDYYLDKWLSRQVYYRLQTEGNPADNPDQRIADDIKQFIEYTLDLTLGLLSSVVTFFSFLGMLWVLSGPLDIPIGGTMLSIPGYLVWVALVYAVGGTLFTKWIGRPLVPLTFNQQRYEADFRFSLVRMRENSESVAFYKGEKAEKQNFVDRFSNVFGNYWQIMLRQKRLGWFTSGYGQIAVIFPYLVVAPRYFAKTIKLGDLMQTASAFGELRASLSYIVDAYVSIATWRAIIDRLTGFMTSIERTEAAADSPETFHAQTSPANDISAEGLTIRLPSGATIQNNISFSVAPGQSLLIQGPSGCGKSTLLRTLAGIWPYASGNLRMPANANALFVPQRPYMPLGTLRQGLLYPGSDASDDTVRELLQTCQLGHFAARLDEKGAWGLTLSLGEQQRVAFFRALLMKQDLVFLDEATSALGEDAEAYFYELLRTRLPKAVIVSVGHRSTLAKWHQNVLTLQAPAKA